MLPLLRTDVDNNILDNINGAATDYGEIDLQLDGVAAGILSAGTRYASKTAQRTLAKRD
jgi:hypothetical protein